RAVLYACLWSGTRLLPGGERGALHGGAATGRGPGGAGAQPAGAVRRGSRARTLRQRPAVRRLLVPERRHLGRAPDRAARLEQGRGRAGDEGAAVGGHDLGAALARRRGAAAPPLRAAGLRGHAATGTAR